MKRHFVLDENVIILAQQGRNERGESDPTCLLFLEQVLANCHALVMGEPFWGVYAGQVRRLQRRGVPLFPGVMPIIASLLRDTGKDTLFPADRDLIEVEDLTGMPGVDAGDRPFVRAAASVAGSILVTTDGRLKRVLEERGVDQQYGFAVLFPHQALLLAGPDN